MTELVAELHDGETRVLEGVEIHIERSPEALVGMATTLWQDREQVARLLRQAARLWLVPGSLYEIRARTPRDFGRVYTLAFVQCTGMADVLLPYGAGECQRSDQGEVLYCRERVPARGTTDA